MPAAKTSASGPTALVDSHAHLDAYPETELRRLMARAARVGVGVILAPGADLASSRLCVSLARGSPQRQHGGPPQVLAAVGVHPIYLSGPLDEDAITTMRSLLREPGVVAVGEVGLDSTGPNPSLQMEALRAMLRLAREADLPVVLHSEGPVEGMLSLVGQAGVAPRGAVVHYFTGDAAAARRYIESGLYVSLGRTLVRRPRLQKVARELPLERLLLETDTYPMPRRATEPAHVHRVAEKLAEIKGLTLEQVAQHTTDNFNRLFMR